MSRHKLNMNATALLRYIEHVRAVVREEISANSRQGGKFGSGLASEGFAGGYAEALDDIEAVIRHGSPGDQRGYWRRAVDRVNRNVT